MRIARNSLALAPVLVLAFSAACLVTGANRSDGPLDKTGSGQSPPSTTIRLRVRVEDRHGKPLPKAKGVLFKITPPPPRGRLADSDPVITKLGATTSQNKDGYVETQALPVKTAYALEIQSDGFTPESTRWTHPQQSGTVELPPVQLRRLGTIAGTIVDRQGQGIANATVIQAGDGVKRLEATTDRKGSFRLGEVPEGPAVFCFDAAGYRFHGTVLTCPSEGARIELERTVDANPRVLKLAAAPAQQWSPEQRAAMVKKTLDPLIDRVLAQPLVAEGDQPMLNTAARLDPERILARLDRLKFARPNQLSGVRYSIGSGLLNHGKPEAALETIAKFEDAESKLQAYLYWFDAEPAKTKYPEAHRLALAKARAILDTQIAPARRPYQLCELGAQLWDLGDRAGARKTFQECQTLLDKTPGESDDRDWLRIQLALAVSRDDVAWAKKLAADLEPAHLIQLAAEIARHHPQDVERFLADVPGDLSLMQLRGLANNFPGLCLRLARQDPAAAERLLLKYVRVPQPKTDAEKLFGLGGSFGLNLSKEFIEFQVTKLKAVCYGLIAEGAATRDPAAARHALAQSIELLRPLRTGFLYPTSQYYHGPAVLMALLVPTAMRLDPALAREVFWRALSLRVATSGQSGERDMLDVDTSLLASLVRFYDRPVAESLLDPVLARARSRSFAGMAAYFWPVRSLALDSPDRALAWADSLCELPTWNGVRARDSARQVVANTLSSADTWDSDPSQRLASELGNVRSVYGVYVGRD